MSRIAKITQVPLLLEGDFANGEIGDLFGTFALVPELFQVLKPFLTMILSPSSLTFRIKELIILRVSFLQQCQYCIKSHAWISNQQKILTISEIQSLLSKNADLTIFSLEEQRLLGWIDAVAQYANPVPESCLQVLKQDFEEFEIVEITVLIGAVIMLNRYCTALGIEPSQVHVDFVNQMGIGQQND